MRRAYFDWAAGAPLHPAAIEAAQRILTLGVGNPSSVHAEGRAARAILEDARSKVARLVGCGPGEVIFTSSGSEANAAALLGHSRAQASKPHRLLVGALEHPSVLLAASAAAPLGAEVVELGASAAGTIDLERARALLHQRPNGAALGVDLLAVQLANNETGAIQPILELAAVASEHGASLHCDAVQAAGKLALEEVTARCDSLSISAHKLGGLAGAGALILRKGLERPPLLPGHQERGRRGGTHSLAAIAAFGAVAAIAHSERQERLARLEEQSRRLEAIISELAPGAIIHAREGARIPGIVSASFPGADGETLLVSLDLAGIAAAHGAACSTGAMEPSHVLLGMGLSAELARSTIRFSVGAETSDEELLSLARALPAALQAARSGG